MIFAAGLSPAWQQIMQFETLHVGEVNRAATANWCASGKVINVGIAAKHLGQPTSLLSLIGGASGESIAAEVEALGILADWIHVDLPTRVCTTILEKSGTTTELVENAGEVADTSLEEFADRFRTFAQVADVTVLTGSVPANASESYYSRLIRNVPARLVLDFRGAGLLQCLPFGPFLVKPNREELETTVGHALTDISSIVAAMKRLNSSGAEWVVVSDGPHSVLATSENETWRFTPPTVEVVNPIGCGDCLAAGIAVKVSQGHSVTDAIGFGIAAAALNATQLLPARLDADAVSELAEKVQFERLND